MLLSTLSHALRVSWGADTAQGDWKPQRPYSLNQCAVTALVVQDYFGGELLRCPTYAGKSHYWNRLPDGTEVDLTKVQFLYIPDYPLLEQVVVRDREYVLSFPETAVRYETLKARVKFELEREEYAIE